MEILSQMWSILGFLTVLQNLLPTPFHSLYNSLQNFLNPYAYFEIPEFNGNGSVDVNNLYRHLSLYLNSVITTSTTATCNRLTVSRSKSSKSISYSVAPNHTVHDYYDGHCVEIVHNSTEEKRSFTLKLPKRRRHGILTPYLEHVAARADEFEQVSRDRRLFTNNCPRSYDSGWSSVAFHHPSTFETLALEPEIKNQLIEDLKFFAEGREFYKKIGRAWKRGYLLYGPPGSGKSSLVAAMADFLCYDVYDLDLSKVTVDSELKALLMQTTNRSIIVIEDVDRSIDLSPAVRRSKPPVGDDNGRVTLSGLLNFTDGLWSCCGEERVVVFTTNRREAVDPALRRCGRIDVHVSLGACGIHAFKILVKNYLGVESHALFDVAERCLRSGGAWMTPAQIGEILLRNRRDADAAVKAVVSAMLAKNLGGEGAAKGEDGFWEAPEKCGGRKRGEGKVNGNWESSVKFLVKIKALSKSESGKRGV